MNSDKSSLHISLPKRLVVLVLTLFTLAPLTNAHPGHSLIEAAPAHLLTSPDHLVVLTFLGLFSCLIARFVRARLLRQLLQVSGAFSTLTAVVLWGISA